MSLRRKLARFSELSGREIALLAEAWFTLAFWRLAVHVRGDRVFKHALTGKIVGAADPPHTSYPFIEQAVGRAAAHHIVEMTCFHRSLTIRTLLRRRNVNAVMRVSVWKDAADHVTGHAWVEVDGRVVGDLPSLAESKSVEMVR